MQCYIANQCCITTHDSQWPKANYLMNEVDRIERIQTQAQKDWVKNAYIKSFANYSASGRGSTSLQLKIPIAKVARLSSSG
jgi:hypothetical protein